MVETDETSESLSQRAYNQLRRDIIRGRYPQGSRLAEQRLAQDLSISRVPLREAVPLLEHDGFVKTLPRRGAVVTTWTRKMLDDLFDLRLCLEAGAAVYAAKHVAQGGSLAPLDQALAQAHDAAHAGDPYRIAQTSTGFHEAIVDVADNELMTRLMRSVAGRVMWLIYLTPQPDVDHAFDDHVALREVIASGNQRMAEAVAYAHIERDRRPSYAALFGDAPREDS
jgi:DNA-binding GntR family transcriptional regulator